MKLKFGMPLKIPFIHGVLASTFFLLHTRAPRAWRHLKPCATFEETFSLYCHKPGDHHASTSELDSCFHSPRGLAPISNTKYDTRFGLYNVPKPYNGKIMSQLFKSFFTISIPYYTLLNFRLRSKRSSTT